MPKKIKPEPLPKDIQIVQFEPGEFRPLFVKAANIEKVVVGLSPKTLANWRSLGIGPAYFIIHGQIYYRFSTLVEFFGGNEIKTFQGDTLCRK